MMKCLKLSGSTPYQNRDVRVLCLEPCYPARSMAYPQNAESRGPGGARRSAASASVSQAPFPSAAGTVPASSHRRRGVMPAGVAVPVEALATLRRRLSALPARHPERGAMMPSAGS